MSTTERWFLDWVSAARLDPYLRAAGHDRHRARRLYEWNARLAAAFLHDLAHLEVGLRNAYDGALRSAVLPGEQHWSETRTMASLFPTRPRGDARTGARRDANAMTRRAVSQAVARARSAPGVVPLPGKVIAELPLGFWTFLSSDRHEKTIWVPYLQSVYPAGTHREDVRDALDDLRRFRDRVAHHESVLRGAELHRRRLVAQVRRLSPEAAADLRARSEVGDLLARRP
jgi:hypothetical protein